MVIGLIFLMPLAHRQSIKCGTEQQLSESKLLFWAETCTSWDADAPEARLGFSCTLGSEIWFGFFFPPLGQLPP